MCFISALLPFFLLHGWLLNIFAVCVELWLARGASQKNENGGNWIGAYNFKVNISDFEFAIATGTLSMLVPALLVIQRKTISSLEYAKDI